MKLLNSKYLLEKPYLLGFVLTVIISLLFLYKFPFFYTLELKNYDLFLKFFKLTKPPNNIVIVGIDDKSLEKVGRWPWSRDKLAKIVDNLIKYNPVAIVFDIILSEPGKNDKVLAESIDNAGNVFLPIIVYFNKKDKAPNPYVIDYALKVIEPPGGVKYLPPSGKSVLAPLKIFCEVAAGLGTINIFPDKDGVVRWESLYIGYFNYFIPSMSLEVAAWYLGIPWDMIQVLPGKGIFLGKRYFVPTDRYGRFLIPYYGPTGTFKTISAVDVLKNRINPKEIQGKIVLIGATAVGIYDLRVTPVSPVMPGVEKHANVIEALIQKRFLNWASDYVTLGLILALGIISSLLFNKLKAGTCSFIYLLEIILIVVASIYLFSKQNYFLPIVYPILTTSSVFLTLITLKYGYSEKQSREIKRIFSNYVTEKVVDQLVKNPSMVKLGGERKELSILFSDIRGFTSLSEKLKPEEVVELLNEYFKEMTEVIFNWEGTLDKFVGDAIMVFWGAPIAQEDHAYRAVACAVDMIKKLKALREKWQKEGKPFLNIGVGINTGEVLVGNIGVEGRKMDYTVIGDHVNLASRLEGLNKQYATNIIISEFTLEKLKRTAPKEFLDKIKIESLGKVKVKGKEKAVEIFKVELK